jgi:hypothetical protein
MMIHIPLTDPIVSRSAMPLSVKNDDDEEEFADDEQFGLPDKFLFLFL